jgi:DNA-binding MarR family transcriptional regulator
MTHINPLSDDIGFLLTRAGAIMLNAANKTLAPFDLRVRSYSVLVLACEHSGGLGQRQIADELGLDPSQIVGLVDDLESRKFIARQVDPEDRRNKRITATASGRTLCAEVQLAIETDRTTALADLSAGDLARLRRLLQVVVGS